MKIRGLLAGLSLALLLTACDSGPTLPSATATGSESSPNKAPPPPDSAARSGGAMGSGA